MEVSRGKQRVEKREDGVEKDRNLKVGEEENRVKRRKVEGGRKSWEGGRRWNNRKYKRGKKWRRKEEGEGTVENGL